MTPDVYDKVFGPPGRPVSLPNLTPEQREVLYFERETTPRDLCKMHDHHGLAVEAFYDEVARTLVYATRDNLPSVVRQCWSALDVVEKYLQEWMAGIVMDERFQALDTESQGRRPLTFVQQAWQEEILGSSLLWGCHHALMRKGDEPDLLRESERRLSRSLTSMARGVSLMMDLALKPIGMLLTMARVSLAVELFRGPTLEQWVEDNPSLCRS